VEEYIGDKRSAIIPPHAQPFQHSLLLS
jgi:hypothetical protein